ncbi:hypothetical protein K461DRAFT_220106 [Myriangium duriaei CBS 260.36]|uniref:Fanconi-associated nuclease n=1 Tax=Myriangium duriaei CBS 260.36 TaxID=1168546 RepID=A0A9P4JEM2_9PEZI|nr:hypothetical protein K461DRAFT_220106 [Myriangium duriaei CBS 260.36]
MTLQISSPSKHNAMLGKKIAHPESTNFDGADDFAKRPIKRIKHTTSAKVVLDSDDDVDAEDLAAAAPAFEKKTDLESALPPIRTDKAAISEYETTRAGEEPDEEFGAAGRLKSRKWVRGKSSIYVDAFNLALDTVLEDESHLFNEAESKIFSDWRELDYEAQYLYVRLFLRKTSSWHRINKLGYYDDVSDLSTAILSLQCIRELPIRVKDEEQPPAPGEEHTPDDWTLGLSYAFADRSEDSITTLEEASSLLLLDELKTLARDAKVQGKNKSDLIKALRKSSSKQTGLRFLKRSDTEDSVASADYSAEDQDSGASTPVRSDGENRDIHFVTKIMNETGPCIRLSLPVLKLFERVHLVFYRSTEWTEKSLTAIILARISRWNFPEYLVSRSANIFSTRLLLLEFEASVRTQFRVDNILEFNGTPTSDTLQDVLDIFEEVYPRWQALLGEEQRKEDSIYSTGEGAYLRRLSPAWVYTRIVHKGAYVLGKFKNHKREHSVLSELLAQTLFHTSRRGDWYQRKALLEEHYMAALSETKTGAEAHKKHWKQKALQTCEEGLQDPLTHLIFHYDLQKRVTKLEKALKIPKRAQHDFGHVRLAKPIERVFAGIQVVRDSPGPVNRRGGKTVWLDPALPEGTEGECSVESMCLSRYRMQGWRGYHCESSIVRTLFAVLFYDVIFTYVPNVFQTPFQTCPLDLHSDAFFPARMSEINARLNEINNGLAEGIARSFYDAHEEKRTCVIGMNWDYTKSDIISILRAWDPSGLATVLKVLAQEYGARGGGVPDLFLWPRRAAILERGGTGEVRFSEVKSENDRLSDTQRMWIHVLTGAGIAVELCHAVADTVRQR